MNVDIALVVLTDLTNEFFGKRLVRRLSFIMSALLICILAGLTKARSAQPDVLFAGNTRVPCAYYFD